MFAILAATQPVVLGGCLCGPGPFFVIPPVGLVVPLIVIFGVSSGKIDFLVAAPLEILFPGS